MEIVWTEVADRDVARTFDYLKGRNVRAARAFLRSVFEAIEQLETMPQMGKVCELELAREYRALIVGPYKVFYTLQWDRETIVIARIWDTRQDPTRLFIPHG